MSDNSPAARNALPTVLDIKQILDILPHRYPFLLVDRVTELVPMQSIRAYKNMTFNENFFQGHFPGSPVMPGVLIIEALAQTGIILVATSLPKEEMGKHLYLFAGIERAKFRRPVTPGDRLDMECSKLQRKLNFFKMETKAYVDGKLAAEATLTATGVPREAGR